MSFNKDNKLILKVLQNYVNVKSDKEFSELKSLSKKFVVKKVKSESFLWELSTQSSDLFFVITGAIAEYSNWKNKNSLIRIYTENSIAFSEDSLLFSKPSGTYAKCLIDSKIALFPATALNYYFTEERVGTKLLIGLIQNNMAEYRNTTYNLLQPSANQRISEAFELLPQLIEHIPKKDLAEFFGISRSSLFRALNEVKNEK